MKNDQKKTILLVEDEILIALAEAETVRNFGYNSIIAASGEEAIEIVRNDDSIDLVLMDIDLGNGIDGPQSATEILKIKSLPVVFLTSHAEKEYVQKIREITRFGYVIKNSGNFILQSSIEMAFELFEANRILQEKEKELQQNELLLHKAQEIGKMGHFCYDPDSGIFEGSPEFHRLLETDPAMTFTEIFHERVHPDEISELESAIQRTISEGIPYNVEHRIVKNNGNIQYLHSKAEILETPYGIKMIGTIQDVTERKNSENALQESEQRFQNLFEQTPLGYQSLDENGCFIEINSIFEEILGYSRSEIIGKWFGDFLAPDYVQLFKKYFPIFKEKGRIHSEFQMLHKNGSRKYISFDGRIGYKPNGSFKQTHCILADITDKVELEQGLKKKETRYREIFNNIHSGIAIYDVIENGEDFDFVFVDFNDSGEKIEKEDKEKLIGKSIYKAWPGIEEYSMMEAFKRVSRTGIAEHCPLEISKDGELVQYYENYIFRLSTNEIVAVFDDVTGRKKIEEALRESEELFSLFMRYSPIYTYICEVYNDCSVIVEASENFVDMIGISGSDMKGKKISELFPKDFAERVRNYDRKVISNGEVLDIDVDFEGRDYHTIKFPIRQGKKTLIAGFTIDVTAQKAAEAKVLEFLAEKEIILKEVHHRIKNNMNTVKSFLDLQVRFMNNKSPGEILKEASNRILSMQVLYDKLYQSEDYNEVSVKTYLSELIEQVMDIFPNKSQIKLSTVIDDFLLDSKRLSYLSIIINELLTNIMKYAFTGFDEGLVNISVELKNEFICFGIYDNGNGMPESVDFENPSGFGFILVKMLAKQLGSTIVFEKNTGTKISLKFRK